MYLKRSGEPEKAVPMLRESVRVLLDDLGPSDTGTQPSVLLLAEAYRALQQWDQAESTLVRYEELLLATPGYDEKIVEVVRDHLAETRAARTEN